MVTFDRMNIEEALIETLEVRKRLIEPKLLLFTRMRFARVNRSPEPKEAAVKTALKVALGSGAVVRLPNRRLELGKQPAKKQPAKKKPKTTPAPQGRVFFMATTADAFEKAKKAVAKRFDAVAPNAFRWHDGPELRLESSTRAEVIRSMRAWQRRWVARQEFETFFCLAFDDVDAVLDEINTLIEAQTLLSKATKSPRFLAWNKTLMSVDDEVIRVFAALRG